MKGGGFVLQKLGPYAQARSGMFTAASPFSRYLGIGGIGMLSAPDALGASGWKRL